MSEQGALGRFHKASNISPNILLVFFALTYSYVESSPGLTPFPEKRYVFCRAKQLGHGLGWKRILIPFLDPKPFDPKQITASLLNLLQPVNWYRLFLSGSICQALKTAPPFSLFCNIQELTFT